MKRPIAILILLTALIAVASLFDASRRSRGYFANILTEAAVRTEVSMGGSRFLVDGGTVTENGMGVSDRQALAAMKLAYEKILAERAPLLGYPGVDPARLSRAVLALRQMQERLADSQTDVRDAHRIRTALYPIRFLESAAALESARRDLIASGDADDAVRYRILLAEASRVYRGDLGRFRAAFLAAVPAGTPSYGTVTSIIDRAESLRILSQFGDDIAGIDARRRTRELCRLGATSACEPLDPSLPLIRPVPPDAAQKRGALRATKALYRDAGFPLSTGPDVRLSASTCASKNALPVFSFMAHGAPASDTYMAPLYTGDLILVKSDPYADSFFYHYFHEHDVEYVLTDPLAYYECPTASFDYAAALSTLRIARFAQAHDLSGFLPPDVAASVDTLRKRLYSTDTILESDAAAYLGTILPSLPQTIENQAVRGELTELSLGLSYKTAGLAEFIATMTEFEDQNLAISQRGAAFDISARNMFYLKSGFTALLRVPSPDTGGSFRPNALPDSSQPYVYYSDLQDSPAVREQIRADLSFFRSVHLGI